MSGMMDTIRYGRWGIWIAPVSMLLCLFAVISAQPGFLSIDCGGKTNYTSQKNITWVTDANYINVGSTAYAANEALPYYLRSLRLFPMPLNKTCYQLPTAPNTPYLLRLSFVVGIYSGFQKLPSFSFSVETLDMVAVLNITVINTKIYSYERILASSGTVMCVCLIRTSESDDPFISSIELRTLRKGMYAEARPGRMLNLGLRRTVGRNSTARYPLDNFDRIWTSADELLNAQTKDSVQPVSSQVPISTKTTKDFPPVAVMQKAWVVNSSRTYFGFSERSFVQGTKSLLLLYFAEIETLNVSESRSFYITINGEKRSEIITMVRNYSAIELPFLSDTTDIQFNLVKAPNSTLGPIINAFELYTLVDTQPVTYLQDIEALDGIKRSFNIKDWISDPCYLIQWKGIGCDRSSTVIRISEIDLSGTNLTGSVPKHIGQLTALVNVSLHSNHLMGALPNFSALTMLERLYLQNNNLTGNVPGWLSELKNLKELHIENNNFSGVIPVQLLNRALKLNYSGNPYLCMHKGECILRNSNKNKMKLKVALGTSLSGILIIALALTVGTLVYRKKFRRKGVEKEPKPFLCKARELRSIL